jgi:uncharacterized lipoprotein YmbA
MTQSRNRRILFGAALLVTMLVQGGCGTTPPAKFFLLSPTATPPASAPDGARARRLGVGPVDLPEYLDRPQIVTRMVNSELRLADDRRWAEPLRDNFTRVLSDDLSAALGTTEVYTFPWWPSQPIDYQIIVKVLRFEGDASGNVTLVARWTIRGGPERKNLFWQRSTVSVPISSPNDYDSLVAASSAALAQLSGEIAAAIEKQLP